MTSIAAQMSQPYTITLGVEVLLGDPRRWVINEMSADARDATFECVADYKLPPHLAAEHYGIRSTVVYVGAPRGPLHAGVADHFYTDVRSILMVLFYGGISKATLS